MRYSKAGFYSIIMLLLVVQVVTANEIVIEGDGNPSYLTFMGDAPEGISAFGVEVRYSNGTQITGVEPVEPFEVVSGIDTAAGTLKIGGYAPPDPQTAVYGQVRLAKIWSAQALEGDIIVDCIEDLQRNPIQVSNQASTSPTPTETSVPVYDPPITYKSPGTVQADPTDYIAAPEIAAQPSPKPQTSAPGTSSTTETLRDMVETQTPSSNTASPTDSPEAGASETPAISPKKAPLMLYSPLGAIFCALLLIKRRKEKRPDDSVGYIRGEKKSPLTFEILIYRR